MTLLCSTRVPQKPTQDHENDSNKGKVANSSSVGVTTAPPVGPFSSQSQGVVRDSKACGPTTGWEGYCTTRKSKGKAGRLGGREWVAANTR